MAGGKKRTRATTALTAKRWSSEEDNNDESLEEPDKKRLRSSSAAAITTTDAQNWPVIASVASNCVTQQRLLLGGAISRKHALWNSSDSFSACSSSMTSQRRSLRLSNASAKATTTPCEKIHWQRHPHDDVDRRGVGSSVLHLHRLEPQAQDRQSSTSSTVSSSSDSSDNSPSCSHPQQGSAASGATFTLAADSRLVDISTRSTHSWRPIRAALLLLTSFVILFLSFSLIPMAVVYTKQQTHAIHLHKAIHHHMFQHNVTQQELVVAQQDHALTSQYLHRVESELELLRHENRDQEQKVESHLYRIQQLEMENGFAHYDLQEVQWRVSSLQGSEEDITVALNASWIRIDELVSELHETETELWELTRAISQWKEKDDQWNNERNLNNERIVQLELDCVMLERELKLFKDRAEGHAKEKLHLTHLSNERGEEIEYWKRMLESTDGDMWAFDVQVRHLEERDKNNTAIISNMYQTNQMLADESQELKMAMIWQLEEAIAAVDAVAFSATAHKEEEIQQLLLEAVGAVNAVAGAAHDERLEDIAKMKHRYEQQLVHAALALNTVADAALLVEKREEMTASVRSSMETVTLIPAVVTGDDSVIKNIEEA